ncbi:sodium-coupled monocarboxylate transporter 1-like [Bacillus rossius redtenbacheri]|uniref:sodium-coupled monocarboxylate transporter 1-like n=1 Tax=Bacillus rossius redtenbacheri TaxID=93214 RepID=UPI002FDE7DF9
MNSTAAAAEGVAAFGWLNHAVFAVMMVASTTLGVLIGVFAKQSTEVDYLLGGRAMSTLPVAVSLVASHVSSITIMGVPTEVYLYGTQIWMTAAGCILTGLAIEFVYLPVFYSLQITSTFEYLERRFNRQVRVMGSFLFILTSVTSLPILVYIPSLAFSLVSGVHVYIVTVVACSLCMFYTMLGGLKAVVWTDFAQSFVTVGACVAVLVLGADTVGGPGQVWKTNSEGGRIEFFNMDPSPFVRNSFWTVTLGVTVSWICYAGVNQGMVQKFLALPTLRDARQSLIIFTVGIILMNSLACFTGLVVYATFHDCDPIGTKAVYRPDQILPFFVMETAANIPCLPGLFMAGIFSASFSTLSSNLNSLAGAIFEDFVKPAIEGSRCERHGNLILRVLVVALGLASLLQVFVVERMGGVLEVVYTLQGVSSGTLVGVFSIGMLYPWANHKGALWGAAASLSGVSWIVVGAKVAAARGSLEYPWLPLSTDGCVDLDVAANFTVTPGAAHRRATTATDTDVFWLYQLSYMYYSVAGALLVFLVGVPVSHATGGCDPASLDPRLLAPFLRRRPQPAPAPHETEMLVVRKRLPSR